MKAEELYSQLEEDFIKPGLWDEWAKHMKPISNYLTDEFKERSMGLQEKF